MQTIYICILSISDSFRFIGALFFAGPLTMAEVIEKLNISRSTIY
ncbi:helix-turn-helix domain-containing protein [Fundicoccus sp. Sow4_H7]